LRFDTILAQYLYQHRKLNLPGIGVFEADSTVHAPEDNDKQRPSLEGITFKRVTVHEPDDDLVEFIKEKTGKMKPLAFSDLESFLALGKQFLYIGKPFYLEGIGTLYLSKDGSFIFTPGEFITSKLEDPNVERSEVKKKSVFEEDRVKHESSNNNIKKFFLALVILAVLGAAGYGGHYLYKTYMANPDGSLFQVSSTPATDTAGNGTQQLSTSQPEGEPGTAAMENTASAPGTYKFVVESTDNKIRAKNRFDVLKSYGNKIRMETKDSVRFKLFFILPATDADTLRIRDSLNRWYYGNSSTIRVSVEK
jgi:hypothetical protein